MNKFSKVTFYISASESDNPADRAAACSCISELAQKIDEASEHVDQLLKILVDKANDPSWVVRDGKNFIH